MLNDLRLPMRARRIAPLVAIAIGVLDAWFFRQWNLNPDGVSYFDLARAVAEHGMGAALNGYWSPLYPLTLGATLKLYRPDADTMFPLVRAIALIIYIGTTFSFDRLVRVVLARSPGYQRQPPWVQTVAIATIWLAYLLLVLKAIGLQLVTPDMGVAAIVFWAAAELVRLTTEPATAAYWMRLGIVLAVGYWWKAILFPVGAVILLIAFAIAWRRRDRWEGPIAGGASFATLALVLIVPVSAHTGRVTFGETGRLNQLWYVNAAPYVWTLCAPKGTTLPLSRVVTVQMNPVVLDRPLTCTLPDRWPAATLPLWYDPSFWYHDTRAYLDPAETWIAVRRNVLYARDNLAESAPVFAVVALAVGLFALLTTWPAPVTRPLIALAVAPIGFYLLVYVELRHIVPFLMCGFLVTLVALLDGGAVWRRGALAIVALAALADVTAHVSEQTLIELSILRHELRGDPRAQQLSVRVARLLAERGLAPGTRVATINTLWNVDWAQRAGLLVRAFTPEIMVSVVQTLDELRDPCARANFAGVLSRNGIAAAVMLQPIGYRVPDGFEPLGDTGYFILPVNATTTALPPACSAAATRSFSRSAAH